MHLGKPLIQCPPLETEPPLETDSRAMWLLLWHQSLLALNPLPCAHLGVPRRGFVTHLSPPLASPEQTSSASGLVVSLCQRLAAVGARRWGGSRRRLW